MTPQSFDEPAPHEIAVAVSDDAFKDFRSVYGLGLWVMENWDTDTVDAQFDPIAGRLFLRMSPDVARRVRREILNKLRALGASRRN